MFELWNRTWELFHNIDNFLITLPYKILFIFYPFKHRIIESSSTFFFYSFNYFLFLLIDNCNIAIINKVCLIFGNYAMNRLSLHYPQHFAENQHFEEILYEISAVVAISPSSVTILVSSRGWIITICRTPRRVSRLMDSLWFL